MVGFQEPVAFASGLELVIRQNLKGQMEAAIELVLPLFCKAAGTNDEAPLKISAGNELP